MLLSHKLIDSIGHIADICHYLTVQPTQYRHLWQGYEADCQPTTALDDCLLGKFARFDNTINFDIGSITLEVMR